MKNRGQTFFSEQEKERIREAVETVETSTSGEVATMVVDSSDSYLEAEFLGALLLAGLVSVIIAVAIHHVTIWSYIPLVFLFYLPSLYLFKKFPEMKLPFVAKKRLEEAVRERAVLAFFEKGLYKTRDETGILVMISLLEHKVWILGDRGINEKIMPEWWRHLALEVAAGIKDNRACEALCAVVAECGEELKKHFPAKPDDRDELSNEVM